MIKFEIKANKKIKSSDFIIKNYNKDFNLNLQKDIQILIDSFNKEYVWSGMFDIEDVKHRIENNETIFILYYNQIPIGYVFFKHINNDTCFGYNLYVVKNIKKPKYSAYWFYNKVTDYMLCRYEKIKVEVEDWNWVIIDIIKNMGYYERRDDI
jgi:hypothetical protein